MTRYRNLIDWQDLDGATLKIEVTKHMVFGIRRNGEYIMLAKLVRPRAPRTLVDPLDISHEDRASGHLADEDLPF